MIPGIDVSNHQRTVDWAQVANAGYRFGFIKATEGTTFKDGYLQQNWGGVKGANMYRGAYHYARPEYNLDARWEVDHYLNTLPKLETGDICILDFEPPMNGIDYRKWTRDWLRYVKEEIGFRPILYSGYYYLQNHNLLNDDELAEYAVWLAFYENVFPPTPPKWPFVAFWQYLSSGSVPGVQGNCDLNWFNGTEDRIPLYGKPASSSNPDLGAILQATHILWSGAQKLRFITADPLASELESAIVTIKRELGLQDS